MSLVLAARGEASPLVALIVGSIILIAGVVQWREYTKAQGHARMRWLARTYYFRIGAALAVMIGGVAAVVGLVQLAS